MLYSFSLTNKNTWNKKDKKYRLNYFHNLVLNVYRSQKLTTNITNIGDMTQSFKLFQTKSASTFYKKHYLFPPCTIPPEITNFIKSLTSFVSRGERRDLSTSKSSPVKA